MPTFEPDLSPDVIKRMSFRELRSLAARMRDFIVDTVRDNGGHLASNLGVVELTLALHRVFSTPTDAIAWDVGHQCYAHKIVTGRAGAFGGLRRPGGISGFPKRSESVHDAFDVGHASTSISSALGLLEARRRLGKPGSAVAVIGDGALTGGLAWEAMCHAGNLGLPLIVVLNDNQMSISRNVGALSGYLSRLSATVRYQRVRRLIDKTILAVPYFGPRVHPFVLRMKRAVKAIFFKESLFADLGFEYAGPIDGHNLPLLCGVLSQAKAIEKPVVVHVVTRKGKGLREAEENPSAYHGVPPLAQPPVVPPQPSALASSSDPIDPANVLGDANGDAGRASGCGPIAGKARVTFTEAFGRAMLELADDDPRLVAVVAAMGAGTGLSEFQARHPGRFHDVGIAEEHAVTFSAGLAAGGLRPVVALYSTFMQRTFDQVHHDVALSGFPVVFAVDRAGAVPDDGETHQGIYDIQAFRAVPGLSIVAPASAAELKAALAWALAAPGPTMIRYPKAACPAERPAYAEPLVPGRGAFVRKAESGADVLFAVSGALVDEALKASDLCSRAGVSADVYHLRFLKPFDAAGFARTALGYRLVVAAEEGVLTGGVSADLAAAIRMASLERGASASGSAGATEGSAGRRAIGQGGLAAAPGSAPTRAIALGFDERPMPHGSRASLLDDAGLSAEALARTALAALGVGTAGEAEYGAPDGTAGLAAGAGGGA